MGDKSEIELCRAVAGNIKYPVLVLAGQTSLPESAVLMQKSKCAIVNDGGPLHIAVACGARTVSIFGPVDPVVYGPYASGVLASEHKVVLKELPCQPCYRDFRMAHCSHHSCLKNLGVDKVFKAVEGFLS